MSDTARIVAELKAHYPVGEPTMCAQPYLEGQRPPDLKIDRYSVDCACGEWYTTEPEPPRQQAIEDAARLHLAEAIAAAVEAGEQ